MTYSVKEVFYTLQGEGAQSGRAAVFMRFTGCNLWSGREKDRHNAICQFCDTDFVGIDGLGGGQFANAEILARYVKSFWSDSECPSNLLKNRLEVKPYIVCTGGEPLLQLDPPLITALHAEGFEIGVETNGTIPVPENLDWICVSPKANTELIQTSGNELKLIYPQNNTEPEYYEKLDFQYFFLQPMDLSYLYGPAFAEHDLNATTRLTIDYCLKNPKWRLSLQTHKQTGLR